MSGETPSYTPKVEASAPQVKKGALARVKGLFFKSKKAAPDLSDLPTKRESASEVLARTTLPQRDVTLGDVSLYNIPFNWQGARRLALAVNRLKETPVDAYDIQRLMPTPEVYDALPWAASAIAHHYNPEIPVILPNDDEVMAMKPWLYDVSWILGKFSPRWQHRFGRFIERKAADKILAETVGNVLPRLDRLAEVEHPQDRFVPEMAGIYKEVTKPQFEDVEDFDPVGDFISIFDDNPKQSKRRSVPIETRIVDLVSEMRAAKYGNPRAWINRIRYPLVSRALEITRFPADDVDVEKAGIVGSEIMQGFETFLRKEKVLGISSAPRPVKTFDLFDGNTWTGESVTRSVAETIAWGKIIAVKRELPYILEEVKNVLPKNGPQIVESARILAENILILSKQGVSNADIAVAMFHRPTTPKA